MASEKIPTFCRICEPQCGIYATVENGRFTGVTANNDHVSSQGHFCKKSAAMVDVVYDADRLLHPLKRTGGPGEFTRISWEQALEEIAAKLKKTRDEYGATSVATYLGNPPYYSYATVFWHEMFTQALGIKWKYHVHAEDGGAIAGSNSLLYGAAALMTMPDLWRTQFLLVVGANPVVSHGSTFSEPRVVHALKEIKDRGGRVVVVDPRRNETAVDNEYISIHAGSDAYLAAALLHEVIAADLVDHSFIAEHTSGFDRLKQLVESCDAHWAAQQTGIEAEVITRLAHDFARSPSAAVHLRMGTSAQRFGTLTTALFNMLCAITGNLDRPGGMNFGDGLLDPERIVGDTKVGELRSRVDNLPDVICHLHYVELVNDIEVPGDEQVHALFMIGANPALASPASGGKMEAALQKLDLFVSQDIYMNETNRLADYILPSATWPESEGIPLISFSMMLRPSAYASKPIIEKRGEVREDWQILDDICRHMGLPGAYPKPLRLLARLGLKLKPRHVLDLLIRMSPDGDKFGLRRKGLSLKKLLNDHPNGVGLRSELPTGVLRDKLATKDKRVDLAAPQIQAEFERLLNDRFFQQAEFPLRLAGMRQKSAHNSWLHNVPKLAKDHQYHTVRISPEDAQRRGIHSGDEVVIRSAYGEVSIAANVTDIMKPGNIALPHGWGHRGSWRLANSSGGVNVNIIASDDPADAEKLSGMSTLNGIPVEVFLKPEMCVAAQ